MSAEVDVPTLTRKYEASEIPEEKDAVWQCVTSVVNYSFFGFAAGGLFGVVARRGMGLPKFVSVMFGISGAFAGASVMGYIRTQKCWASFVKLNAPLGEDARKALGISVDASVIETWSKKTDTGNNNDSEEFKTEKPMEDEK